MNFILLIISLPTENATIRMRTWRAVKASGAMVLRDGVYLLPNLANCHLAFEAISADVQSGGGTSHLMQIEALDGSNYYPLFDRHEAYALLQAEIDNTGATLSNASLALKQLRKLRKTFATLVEIDFFPGEAQKQTSANLQAIEMNIKRQFSPDEPQAVATLVAQLSISDYQGRTWATRQRPWVDRLASAWLIRRFIDADARFIWLAAIAECPNDALGFDFDGATFSHTDSRVTFEVLIASFSLDYPGLKKLAALVHYLDVGGIQIPEAIGVEAILAGLCDTINDDNQLLISADTLFDSLLVTFAKGVGSE